MTHAQAHQRQRNMEPYLRSGELYSRVARRFGVSTSFVATTAKRFGISRGAGLHQRKDRFSSVDWRKRDVDIAKEIGCTRERVRQVRIKMGKPRSPVHHQGSATIQAVAWVGKNRARVSKMTVTDVVEASPIKLCRSTWHRLLRSIGIEPIQPSLFDSIISRDDLKSHCEVTGKGCWEWKHERHPNNGYSRLSGHYGHRIFYEKFIGEIPLGLLVMHSCDNPPCVNPDHLFIGTHQDNVDDAMSKGRRHHRRATPELVKAIRAASKTSKDFYQIGRTFGISGSTAWKIAKRKTYQDVA